MTGLAAGPIVRLQSNESFLIEKVKGEPDCPLRNPFGNKKLFDRIFNYIPLQEQKKHARVSKLFDKNLNSVSLCTQILTAFDPKALLIPNLFKEPDLLIWFTNTTLRNQCLKEAIDKTKQINTN
jgi:hypothetical protein